MPFYRDAWNEVSSRGLVGGPLAWLEPVAAIGPFDRLQPLDFSGLFQVPVAVTPQPSGEIELIEPAAMLESDLPSLDSLTDHHALLSELHVNDITWVDGVATISAE